MLTKFTKKYSCNHFVEVNVKNWPNMIKCGLVFLISVCVIELIELKNNK